MVLWIRGDCDKLWIIFCSRWWKREGGRLSFYYFDEKFTYIHSDMERAFLSVIIAALQDNAQIFFTTHNTDILDMPLPRHSFIFLRKGREAEGNRIDCVKASDYIKRNTDSLKNAVENDLFSCAPATDLIFDLLDE